MRTGKLTERTLPSVLKQGVQFLIERHIDSAKVLAERLLEGLLDCKRYELYLDHGRVLSASQLETYFSFLKQRAQGIPSQYILGRADFMDFTFQVNASVLIPRPETEFLVEKVLQVVETMGGKQRGLEILDVGTGSGNIAVSLASYLPKASVWAVDISDEALEIARRNAMRNEVGHRIQFLRSDLFNNIPSDQKFDLVVSNPPYLSEQDWRGVCPEVSYEPPLALLGGREGTEFIEKLVEQAPAYLLEDGRLLFEIGFDQGPRVGEILRQSGCSRFEIFKDYGGLDRVVVAENKVWKK